MSPEDQARRAALIAAGESGPLDEASIDEITALERRHHAFQLMCMRTAPLNPTAVGYRWGERIEHAAAPGVHVEIRTGGTVLMDGETISLMAATHRIAAIAKRGIALADWSGPSGRLGDLAGLEHPPSTALTDARPKAEDEAGAGAAGMPASPTPSRPRKPEPTQAAIGDLFD